MKKLLALFGALALIICVSSCSSGYDAKKVEKVLTQLHDGEIDDDLETTEFLAKQWLTAEKQYYKECIKIAKKCSTRKEYFREREKMEKEKFPKINKVIDYVERHRDQIPELWEQLEDIDHDKDVKKDKKELDKILDELE